MPITMFAFVVGSFGMCGLPPVSGFVSKWFLGLGTLEAGKFSLLLVLLLSSFLDVVYFFPIIYTAFFGRSADTESKMQGSNQIEESPMSMVVPLSITAFFAVLFTFPNPATDLLLRLARMAVSQLGGG
jgi:formate hydrogenlyase subunit 3/multisubunit Na+/H+ antiporter MnhD subunit